MIQRPVLLFALLPLLCAAAARAQEPARLAVRVPPSAAEVSSDSAAIVAAVFAHWNAMKAGDSLRDAAHHTPCLTIFAAESPQRLTATAPEAADFHQRMGAHRPGTLPDRVQVQLYGDAGVATYYLEGDAAAHHGVDPQRRRVTEVWVRREASWRVAHRHESIAAPLPLEPYEDDWQQAPCRTRKDCYTWW
jgi:ketosteroid isomerase-like protein